MNRLGFFLFALAILSLGCTNKRPGNNGQADTVNTQANINTTTAPVKNQLNEGTGQTTLDSLQGIWVSTESDNNGIKIVGDTLYDFADGSNFDTSTIYLDTTCIKDKSLLKIGAKNGTVLNEYSAADDYLMCFYIDELTSSNLLFYYNGKAVGYHRKK